MQKRKHGQEDSKLTNETAQVHPTNVIVVDNRGLRMQTKKVETATNVYPGRLVKKGTNDDDVVVGSEPLGNLGWAGYEHTTKKYRPVTAGTIYAQNDQIAVINGPGIVLLASVISGSAAVKGILLKGGAAGQLDVAGATDAAVAVAEESVTGGAGGSRIMVRSSGSGSSTPGESPARSRNFIHRPHSSIP